MKKNSRNLATLTIVLIVSLVAIFSLVFGVSKPEQVTVAESVATIRLPGEFKGQAKISYNSEYVEQSEANSILTLTFKKQGYYMCSVGNNEYLFKVLNMDNSECTIDLIREEYSTIMLRVTAKCIMISIILWIAVLVILFIVYCSVHKKEDKKVQKFEVE